MTNRRAGAAGCPEVFPEADEDVPGGARDEGDVELIRGF